jgi:hypothetical protein
VTARLLTILLRRFDVQSAVLVRLPRDLRFGILTVPQLFNQGSAHKLRWRGQFAGCCIANRAPTVSADSMPHRAPASC